MKRSPSTQQQAEAAWIEAQDTKSAATLPEQLHTDTAPAIQSTFTPSELHEEEATRQRKQRLAE